MRTEAATLEALYNINKHAKRYGRRADEDYRVGKGAGAKSNSLKKKALYGAKSVVIKKLVASAGETDRLLGVESHTIDGQPFLCFYFVDENGFEWSFHQPEAEVAPGQLPEDVGIDECDPEEFDDFASSESKDRSKLSLKASLLHLESVGVNANDHLEQTHVSYGRDSHFAGWPYLGDGGERADPTPQKTRLEAALCAVDGIGLSTARTIAAQYDSVDECEHTARENPADFEAISGIGPATASTLAGHFDDSSEEDEEGEEGDLEGEVHSILGTGEEVSSDFWGKGNICEFCSRAFRSTYNLNDHLVEAHPDDHDLFECEFCDKKYREETERDEHERNAHPPRHVMGQCSICGSWCASNQGVRDHARAKHPDIAPEEAV
jgi:hypothetical protein